MPDRIDPQSPDPTAGVSAIAADDPAIAAAARAERGELELQPASVPELAELTDRARNNPNSGIVDISADDPAVASAAQAAQNPGR